MDQDLSTAAAPINLLQDGGEAPQKYIRTYARDMATVQKGGTPDLVPLASAPLEKDATAPQALVFAPPQKAASTVKPPAAAAPPPSRPPPQDAVVTTYDRGFRDAADRTETKVAKSPAGVAWEASAKERDAVRARLEEKARARNLPTTASAAKPAPPRVEIRANTPPAIAVAPPAGALSVPAYTTSFTLGVPGEPVPPPPPPPPEPVPQPPAPAPAEPEFVAEPNPVPAPEPFFIPPEPHPAPAPVAPHAPAAPPPPATLHTYATDFSDRVGETHASRVAILAAEADARQAAPVRPVPVRQAYGRARLYASIALVLLGTALLYGAYARFLATSGPVTLAFAPSAPIFVDDRETVSGSGPALLTAVEQAAGRPLADGTVRLLYDPSATSTSLFNALQLPAPDVLLRNVNADGSMAGIISENGEQTPFFILSVSSYGDTFAGMLAWESGSGATLPLVRALAALYPPRTDAAAQYDSTTTITVSPAPAPLAPAIDQGFTDEVVANHDARVYRDSENRTILIYGYWDQSTLVIARDEAAFTAILARLANSHTSS